MDSTTPTGIEAIVCRDIAERQKFGINKYGTTVADNPLSLRQWLEHAYMESLDLPIYLRRAMAQIDAEIPQHGAREPSTALLKDLVEQYADALADGPENCSYSRYEEVRDRAEAVLKKVNAFDLLDRTSAEIKRLRREGYTKEGCAEELRKLFETTDTK
jgi:hypothetical protein